MKLILATLLIMVCSIGYSYAHNHLIKSTAQQAILNTASNFKGQLETADKHSINRRQVANQERCTAVAFDFQCTSDYNQALVNISANCGNNKQARNFAGACARNNNDQYCAIAAMNLPTTTATCSQFGSCSSGCRSYLRSLRSILGCCINSFLNFTDSPVQLQNIFSYSLWSRCGVETVESCNNGIVFTPIFNNKVCTDDDLHQQLAVAECSPPYSQQIVDALTNAEGCEDFLLVERDNCAVNSQGEHCGAESRDELISFTETGTATVVPVINNCATTLSSRFCSSSCRRSLQTLRNDLGCCANLIYNNPNLGNNPLVPSALWDQCGVTNPGLCDAATQTERPSIRTAPLTQNPSSEPTNRETMNQSTQQQRGDNSAGLSTKAFSRLGVILIAVTLLTATVP